MKGSTSPWLRRAPQVTFLVVLTCWITGGEAWGNDDADVIRIRIAPHNQADVQAELFLPVPLVPLYALLTNYPEWPKLFPHRLIINDLLHTNEGVIMNMTMSVPVLPVWFHLRTVTQGTEPTRVETRLLEGDFDQYHWVWELQPMDHPGHTRAILHLTVQPKFWLPEWIFRWVLKRNLEAHFRLLRIQAAIHLHTDSHSEPK